MEKSVDLKHTESSPHNIPSFRSKSSASFEEFGSTRELLSFFESSPNHAEQLRKSLQEKFDSDCSVEAVVEIEDEVERISLMDQKKKKMLSPMVQLQQRQTIDFNSKRALIQRIRQNSIRQIAFHCQAVLVRGPAKTYHTYHIEVTNDFYKQKWVVCKRFSEMYRFRKKILTHLHVHRGSSCQSRACPSCSSIYSDLKSLSFPNRLDLLQDPSSLLSRRVVGIEEFLTALCQLLSTGSCSRGESDMILADHPSFLKCVELNTLRNLVKESLHFPLEHERQHIEAIRELNFVDYRDVDFENEACPICLGEWRELDGNQLVQAKCGHFFHEHCINEWYGTRFDCPMCRANAGADKRYPMM